MIKIILNNSKGISFIGFAFLFLISCKSENRQESTFPREIVTSEYHLLIPTEEPEALLFLFPGFPETIESVRRNFKIAKPAHQANIAVCFASFNHHLWLENADIDSLLGMINEVVGEFEKDSLDLYFGGFSSGGVVAPLIAAKASQDHKVEGVFMVDSPIDLELLYESAQYDITRDLPEWRLGEPRFIVSLFESRFGESAIDSLRSRAVYSQKSNSYELIEPLKDAKLRLYTEPDTAWWTTERFTQFEHTNAFAFRNFYNQAKSDGWEGIELIETSGKGYRADGTRHPHSWSIVGVDDLLNWISD